jgi:predicted DNA-binding protein (MmcQ/YjbR family)
MMTLDAVREFCRALPGATEDVKWGNDLVFSVGGKMFAVVCLEPPHQISFKCTPEEFAELIEREGIIPAPYLARAMWVQERELGEVLDRRERERLLGTAYELVRAKLSRVRRASAQPAKKVRTRVEVLPPAARSSRRVRAPLRRRRG